MASLILSPKASSESFIFCQMVGGYDKNYSYLIGCHATKQLALIDSAVELQLIERELNKFPGYELQKVFLTHAHHDHVFSLKELVAKYSVAVYAHESEAKRLLDLCGVRLNQFISDRQLLQIGKEMLLPISTPGHQVSCFCFLWRDKLFSGDTLFIDGCGRCNFPESNIQDQLKSLILLANQIDDSVEVLPGHAYGSVSKSTIGREKQFNKYFIGLHDSLRTSEIESQWLKLRA